MKKIFFLLLAMPLLFACSSDDGNDGKEPEGEKIEVKSSDIIGEWNRIDNNLEHRFIFYSDEINGTYQIHKDGKMLVETRFTYSITGYNINFKWSIVQNYFKNNEDIYKRDDKLYIANKPYIPYVKE